MYFYNLALHKQRETDMYALDVYRGLQSRIPNVADDVTQ